MRAAFVVTVVGGALVLGCEATAWESRVSSLCPDAGLSVGSPCTLNEQRCSYSLPCLEGTFGGGTSYYECRAGQWALMGTAKCNPPPDGGVAPGDAGGDGSSGPRPDVPGD
jgi:hypothetical protein